MFEYVILLYVQSKVITIIGFADAAAAQQAFEQAYTDNQADWAYLYKGDGSMLGSYGVNQRFL